MLRFILFLLFSSLLTISCQNQKQKNTDIIDETDIVDEHTSMNSVDYIGVYEGTLPCDDCDGISTQLSIQENGDYTLSTMKQGDAESYSVVRGAYGWSDNGSTIHLEDGSKYKVGEGKIFPLNEDGTVDDTHMLNMKNVDITDTRWKVIELNKKEVTEENTPVGVPYLVLSEDGKFDGKAGCNRLFGDYSLGKSLQIQFSNYGITKIACPRGSIENTYIQFLNDARSLSIQDNQMVFYNDNMERILVYEPDFIQ